MDWTKISKDPMDGKAMKAVYEHIKSIRTEIDDLFIEHVKKEVSGKRVLDIGVCEHDFSYLAKERWRHKVIKENAAYCLGVDILQEMIDELNRQGYNIRYADATSDIYLGEKFDVVFIGDVIEHVDRPADLLRFAKRHLLPGGKIIVTTPNPFYYRFFLENIRYGTSRTNLEHVVWISPFMALELSRRTGLKLSRYVFFKHSNRYWKFLVKKIAPPELISPMHYYEFTLE